MKPRVKQVIQDCADVMEACADQISTGCYISPAELNAVASQLTEYAAKARVVIMRWEGNHET